MFTLMTHDDLIASQVCKLCRSTCGLSVECAIITILSSFSIIKKALTTEVHFISSVLVTFQFSANIIKMDSSNKRKNSLLIFYSQDGNCLNTI